MEKALSTPGDIAPKKRDEQLDEYLVKETFVPTHHGSKTRKMMVRKKKVRKEESPLGMLCAMVVEHQLGLSINLLLLLALTHAFFPRARRRTRKFFEMAYYNPVEGDYTQGVDDLYFVAFWIVAFTGLRVAIMDYVLRPIARAAGINSKKGVTRFIEQGWMCFYYTSAWCLGMYIMYNSNYWFNLRMMWAEFPTRTMTGLMKWYYLVQSAFWLQQLFVVNIEEHRKDHWQMFTHHIFTSVLMFCSYGFYQTKVGNVILCIMDVTDILLAFAKILKYLNFATACDIAFGAFISVWFITRHIFYLMVCWSIYAHVPSADMRYGCFDSVTGAQLSSDGGNEIWRNVMQPFDAPEGITCFNNKIRLSFLSLLMALQVLTVIWFGMIVRVAYRVICGKGADDTRSDDEGESSEEEEEEEEGDEEVEGLDSMGAMGKAEVHAGEKEVVSERPSTPLRRSERRSATTKASGISIQGHVDKKELLGRIGCDKPS